jgi:hypothetical protein
MSLLILFPSGTSGTTYTQAFSEAWSASEAQVRVLGFKMAFAETWAASETLATIKRFKNALVEAWAATEAFATNFIGGGGGAAFLGLLKRIFTKQS